MHRTVGDGFIIDPVTGKNVYADEDLIGGRPATQLRHEEMNAIQEEICAVIESSGFPLNGPAETIQQMNQLNSAIDQKISFAILSEQGSRITADGDLQTQIWTNADAIAAETTARSNADTLMADDILDLQQRMDYQELSYFGPVVPVIYGIGGVTFTEIGSILYWYLSKQAGTSSKKLKLLGTIYGSLNGNTSRLELDLKASIAPLSTMTVIRGNAVGVISQATYYEMYTLYADSGLYPIQFGGKGPVIQRLATTPPDILAGNVSLNINADFLVEFI